MENNNKPPFQGEISELNNDAINVLSSILLRLENKNIDTDDSLVTNGFRLNDGECNSYFRKYSVIRKIITKYPIEAKNIGYEIHDSKGVIVETGDEIILEAFKEASIFARLYSRCYLKFEFENNLKEDTPLKIGDKIIGYKILHDINREGDFYFVETERVHYHRILPFYGVKSYSKYMNEGDINYADSVLQGIIESFLQFLDNNDNARFILRNLSYLTVGIDNLANKTNSPEGEQAIYNRMSSFNLNRSMFKTLTYDAQKEKVDYITQTLSGVKDIVETAQVILVSNSDYPVEQIFEQSPSQALGSGIQNQLVARYLWAKRCRSWVIESWLPNYRTLFSRIKDMKNKAINIPFIVELTEDEKAEIQLKGANRIKELISNGVISVNEARTGYLGDEYSLNIELEETPELKTKSTGEIKDNPNTSNKDALPVPDNAFWDELANVTIQDINDIGQDILV